MAPIKMSMLSGVCALIDDGREIHLRIFYRLRLAGRAFGSSIFYQRLLEATRAHRMKCTSKPPSSPLRCEEHALEVALTRRSFIQGSETIEPWEEQKEGTLFRSSHHEAPFS